MTGGPSQKQEGDQPRLQGPWWFPGRRELSEEQRQNLLAQLYFTGADRGPFLRRFSALLSFAVLIAVFGLAEDSGPVVIGAMLISPLTTPLLGLAAGMVMGWPRRQFESLLILFVASVGGIALAWLALFLIPEPAAITVRSSELLARTEPSLLDLGVALVAGGAGAYVLVRREAIGALPGVAIAVALVPPLSAVGMTLELGEPELAGQALLLYGTNLAGIVLAAAVVMLVTGVRAPEAGRGRRGVRAGVIAALAAVVVVTVPLVGVSAERTRDALDHDRVVEVTEGWIAGTGMQLRSADVDDGRVHLELAGPEHPGSLDELAAALAESLDEPVNLSADWVETNRLEASAMP